ncbi:MAG: FAD-dependent oxidoreductase, partial [Pseudomonadota bacterium]
MSINPIMQDAVIIGGGFYGAAIATYLAQNRGFKHLTLLEREASLFMRASRNNQARVHNGYHYPRNFTTAYRSRINLPRFVRNWPESIKQDFTQLYAIARRQSKVTSKQFESFCRKIGATLRPVPLALRALFDPNLIEDVFLVEEYAFDVDRLAYQAEQALCACGINVQYQTEAMAISSDSNQMLSVAIQSNSNPIGHITSRYVFNCAYSRLNQFGGGFSGTQNALQHEITEMALIQMPPALQELGVTVMDGPFFSAMPYPSRGHL